MRLRILDFGAQPPLRSQAIYHGLGAALRADDDPILALVTPSAPYICIGVHQDLAQEIDEAWCRAAALPIVRRQTGGGAVYLDGAQLFFQFIVPRDRAPRSVKDLYPFFAEPVLRAYRALGIPATLQPLNDIHVNGRKIGGTGAASIGAATIFVGSFLFDFDAATMARCVQGSPAFRARFRAALDEHLTTVRRERSPAPAPAHFQRALVEQAAAHFGALALNDRPLAHEREAIDEAERELGDPEWLYQPGRKFVAGGVKIAADTFLTEGEAVLPAGRVRVLLVNRGGRIADLALDGDYAGFTAADWDALSRRLVGSSLDQAPLVGAVASALTPVKAGGPGYVHDIAVAIARCVHRD